LTMQPASAASRALQGRKIPRQPIAEAFWVRL
jgi:hypothetical protein